jgi:hypothetical protein
MAVEQLIFARDPTAALKIGQARGAVLCAGLKGGVTVHEYSPKSVKLAVVGSGGADKAQVQHMVRILLNLETAGEDEADALAIALCHAHSMGSANAPRRAPAAQARRGELAGFPAGGLRVDGGDHTTRAGLDHPELDRPDTDAPPAILREGLATGDDQVRTEAPHRQRYFKTAVQLGQRCLGDQ